MHIDTFRSPPLYRGPLKLIKTRRDAPLPIPPPVRAIAGPSYPWLYPLCCVGLDTYTSTRVPRITSRCGARPPRARCARGHSD
eukprot:1778727-Prymnesium_polylepis.1